MLDISDFQDRVGIVVEPASHPLSTLTVGTVDALCTDSRLQEPLLDRTDDHAACPQSVCLYLAHGCHSPHARAARLPRRRLVEQRVFERGDEALATLNQAAAPGARITHNERMLTAAGDKRPAKRT